jgi:hypothetical protein
VRTSKSLKRHLDKEVLTREIHARKRRSRDPWYYLDRDWREIKLIQCRTIMTGCVSIPHRSSPVNEEATRSLSATTASSLFPTCRETACWPIHLASRENDPSARHHFPVNSASLLRPSSGERDKIRASPMGATHFGHLKYPRAFVCIVWRTRKWSRVRLHLGLAPADDAFWRMPDFEKRN